MKKSETHNLHTVNKAKSKFKQTIKYAWVGSLPIMAGYLLLGAGFGILLQSKGYGVIWAAAMSIFIFAGSMQYVAIDLLTGGATLIAAALMTVAVNARHLIYGISMLNKYKNAGKYKPYLIFSLTDETYSILCDGQVPENVDEYKYYFLVSMFNQLYWIIGSAIGAAVGNVIPFSTQGIDFSMTALFVVVFINQWRNSKHHFNAYLGVLGSILCLAIFGANNFIIPAMIVIVVGLCFAKRKGAKEIDNE